RLDGLLGGDVAGDDGAFGGVVDGGADPVESVELPFDAVRACGAGHPGDVDGDRFVRWCGAVGGELVGGHGGHRVRSLSESFLSMSLEASNSLSNPRSRCRSRRRASRSSCLAHWKLSETTAMISGISPPAHATAPAIFWASHRSAHGRSRDRKSDV